MSVDMRYDDAINPEIEEDGAEHLREMLRTDEEFRALWETNRAKREFGYAVLQHRLDLGLSQRELAAPCRHQPKQDLPN